MSLRHSDKQGVCGSKQRAKKIVKEQLECIHFTLWKVKEEKFLIIKKKKSGDISLSIHQSYLLKVCVISKAVENHTNLYSEQDSRTDFT